MASQTRTRRINIYVNGKQVTNDIRSIRQAMNKLRNETIGMDRNSKQYVNNMRQIRQLDGIIRRHNQQLRATHTSLISIKGLANAFNKYWPMIMGTIGSLAGLLFSVKRTSEMFAEFDDKVADVMKTTGLTRDQVMKLNETFKQMDTRSAKNELMELAWVAGKLGLTAEEDILGFVRAADIISVSLSKDLGGSAQEAVTTLGKLINVFNLKEEYGIEEALIRTASALNELGMSSEASEKNIVNFISRTGGIANLAGVSISKLMGLGAVIDALGLSTEVAGTSYSMFMSRMAKDTTTFANLAQMDLASFNELVEQDSNEAMLRVLESILSTGSGFGILAKALDTAGMAGQRSTSIFAALASATDKVRREQRLAELAFAEGTSVINEFNIKNTNAQAIIEKKRKVIKNLREELGEKLLPLYMEGTNIAVGFYKAIGIIIEYFYKKGAALIALTAALVAYQLTIKSVMLLQRTWNATLLIGRGNMLLMIAAYSRLTGNLKRATAAMRLFNMSVKVNPYALVIGTLLAAVAGIYIYNRAKGVSNHMEEMNADLVNRTNKAMERQSTELDLLFIRIKKTLPGSEERIRLIQQLNDLFPDYITNHDILNSKLSELQKAENEYNDEMQRRIELQVTNNKLLEVGERLTKANKAWASQFQSIHGSPYYWENLKREREQLQEQYDFLADSYKLQVYRDAFGEEFAKRLQIFDQYDRAFRRLQDGQNVVFGERIYYADDANALAYFDEMRQTSKEFLDIMIEDRKDKSAKELEELKKSKTAFIYTEEWYDEQLLELQQKYLDNRNLSFKEYDEQALNLRIKYLKGRLEESQFEVDEELKIRNELFTLLRKKYEEKGEELTEIDLLYAHEQHKIRKSFIDGEITTTQEYNDRLLSLEIEKYSRILANQDTSEGDRIKAQEKYDEIFIKQREDRIKRIEELEKAATTGDPVATEKKRFQDQIVSLGFDFVGPLDEREMAAYQAILREHNRNLNKIDADAINDYFGNKQKKFEFELSSMKQAHSEQLEAVSNNAKEHEKLKKEYQEKEKQFTLNHIHDMVGEINDLMSGIDIEGISFADKYLSEEEREEFMAWLKKMNEEKAKLIGKDPQQLEGYSIGRTDILGFTVEDWDLLFSNLEQGKIGIDEIAFAVLALADAYAQYSAFVSKIEDKQLRKREDAHNQEKERLRQRLDQGIISQEAYNKKIGQLDQDLDREKAIIARKQAAREKAVALMAAIVNTARAVVAALPNLALSIIVGALGAIQIGLIAATPLPNMPGAEEGGTIVRRSQDGKLFSPSIQPKKRGYIHGPTVIVGESGMEYVVPDEAMSNPTIRPILDAFEVARLQDNLATVDFGRLMARGTLRGSEMGGRITKTETIHTTTPTSDPELKSLLREQISTNQELKKELKKGLKAVVSLYGHDGLYRSMELDGIIKRNANL